MSEQWDGVPENPERDGWHWLHHKEDLRPIPAMWNAELAGWTCGPLYSPGGIVELGYTYLGSCLTPAEVAAREAASAEAMREACAGVAQQVADEGAHNHYVRAGCIATRDSIRALALPHASALARAEKAAYQRGWNDRESDFLAGAERTGMTVVGPDALAAAEKRGMEKAAKWHRDQAAKHGEWRNWGGPSDRTEQLLEQFHKDAETAIRNAAAQESEG